MRPVQRPRWGTATALPGMAVVAFTVAALALPKTAAAEPDGAKLHHHNCTSCHDTRVYTRPERRVTSRDGLTAQVRRCELALGLTWFDDQIDAVATYLNDRYYQFNP